MISFGSSKIYNCENGFHFSYYSEAVAQRRSGEKLFWKFLDIVSDVFPATVI